MAILKTCCCWKSVRDGSFACGIYTMIFYTIVVAVGIFHLNPAIENKVLFAFGLVALCLSGMCVLCSALLIVGLCADNRTFLVPWLISVSMTTIMDIFLSFYFIVEDSHDPMLAVLFVTDFVVCAINVYCLLCVISQYQEYTAGRGRPEDCIQMEPVPGIRCMQFNWPSFQALNRNTPEPTDQPQKAPPSGLFLSVPPPDGAAPFKQSAPVSTQGHRSHDSVDSSTRLIVENFESISENTPSTRSVETEEMTSCN